MLSNTLYWIRKTLSTGFFLGYFPYGPGTVGAAMTILLFFFAGNRLDFLIGPENGFTFWWIMIALIAFTVFITSDAKNIFGRDDPPQVILDEITGMFITFFMVPITVRTLLLGFVLFRFFDIVKPFPVYTMEEMEDGVGITMDDVAAGVMANISLILILFIYKSMMGWL